jgi:hypothetical protein
MKIPSKIIKDFMTYHRNNPKMATIVRNTIPDKSSAAGRPFLSKVTMNFLRK